MSIDQNWLGSRLSAAAAIEMRLEEKNIAGNINPVERESLELLRNVLGESLGRPVREQLGALAIIDDHNLDEITEFDDQRALVAGKPVAAILTTDGPATGFLIGESLLLTNHHVFPSPESANGSIARLNFERSNGQLNRFQQYAIDPAIHYMSDSTLDAAVVGVRGSPGEKWGTIDLSNLGEPKVGGPAYVIQHPHGLSKQISVRDNEIRKVTDDNLLYVSDTERGSSGAPVFDEEFRIIGLHVEGGLIAELDISNTPYFANRGVRMPSVVKELGL